MPCFIFIFAIEPAKCYRVFTRSSKRPVNFQQTSSISTCILNTFAGSLLDVCWIV